MSGQATTPKYQIDDCQQIEVPDYVGAIFPEDLVRWSGTSSSGVKRLTYKMVDGGGDPTCSGTVTETLPQLLTRCVSEGGWFWDYSAGRIYVCFNPASYVNPPQFIMRYTYRWYRYSRVAVTTWPGNNGAAFGTDSVYTWNGGLLQNVVVEGFAQGQGNCAVDTLTGGNGYYNYPNGLVCIISQLCYFLEKIVLTI